MVKWKCLHEINQLLPTQTTADSLSLKPTMPLEGQDGGGDRLQGGGGSGKKRRSSCVSTSLAGRFLLSRKSVFSGREAKEGGGGLGADYCRWKKAGRRVSLIGGLEDWKRRVSMVS